eukprot:97501-Rhodomonas_salina.1
MTRTWSDQSAPRIPPLQRLQGVLYAPFRAPFHVTILRKLKLPLISSVISEFTDLLGRGYPGRIVAHWQWDTASTADSDNGSLSLAGSGYDSDHDAATVTAASPIYPGRYSACPSLAEGAGVARLGVRLPRLSHRTQRQWKPEGS